MTYLGQVNPPLILGPNGLPYRTSSEQDPPPSGLGEFAIPHAWTFQQFLFHPWRMYWGERFDAALRHEREDAYAMEADGWLMALLRERMRGTGNLPWHLEVPDEKDKHQRKVRDGLTNILRYTPEFRRMVWQLLWAIWYGRSGVQLKWRWAPHEGGQNNRALTIVNWSPVHGDKVRHRYDGTPVVRVYGGQARNLPGQKIIPTTDFGYASVLDGTMRGRFVIHYHEMIDAEYFAANEAEKAYGLGERDRIFWLDWLRKEYVEWITTYIERVGLGVTVWKYDAANPTSENRVKEAAKRHDRRMNVFVPVWRGEKGEIGGIDRLETPIQGIHELGMIVKDFAESKIERCLVGQPSSGGSPEGGGGADMAQMHGDTKKAIILSDAMLLQESITGHERRPGFVSIIKRWTYPWADFPVRFVFDVEREESPAKLNAISTLWNMGVSIRADDARSAAGISKPTGTDEVIKRPEPPDVGGMMGMPPGAGGMTPGTGAVSEDTQGIGQTTDAAAPEGDPQKPAPVGSFLQSLLDSQGVSLEEESTSGEEAPVDEERPVGAEGVGAEGVGAEGVGAEGVGAEGAGAEGAGDFMRGMRGPEHTPPVEENPAEDRELVGARQ